MLGDIVSQKAIHGFAFFQLFFRFIAIGDVAEIDQNRFDNIVVDQAGADGFHRVPGLVRMGNAYFRAVKIGLGFIQELIERIHNEILIIRMNKPEHAGAENLCFIQAQSFFRF